MCQADSVEKVCFHWKIASKRDRLGPSRNKNNIFKSEDTLNAFFSSALNRSFTLYRQKQSFVKTPLNQCFSTLYISFPIIAAV